MSATGYGPTPRPTDERFWEKVNLSEGCWEWTGMRAEKGYGLFRINRPRKIESAQRVAWLLVNGPIPNGLFVLHSCDNPPCVNPAHLFLGTRGDNNRDAQRKGRTAKGGRHGLHRHPSAFAKDPITGRFLSVTGKSVERGRRARLHGPSGVEDVF